MTYEIGQKIQIEFTGIIGTNTGPNGTVQIKEKDRGYVHYLYLRDKNIFPSYPAEGDTVEISFTGRISGEPGRGITDYYCTTVTSDGEFTHYMYLTTPSIRLAEKNTEENKNPMAYTVGQKVRVKFTGTVGYTTGPNSTVRITEKGNGTLHYLFRGDKEIFPGDFPNTGDTVEVDFTATVASNTSTFSADYCTKVTTKNHTNYVYLDSRAVSLDSGNTKEMDKDMAYDIGDTVKVEFTGTVTGTISGGQAGTTMIREEHRGFSHFLYLGDERIFEGNQYPGGKRPAPGDTVKISLTAVITGSSGDGDLFTRKVNRAGFTHYVYLGSENVSKVKTASIQIPIPEPVPAVNTEKEENPVTYVTGDTVKVEFSGRISEIIGPVGTRRVQEVNTVGGFVHYLYPSDMSIFPGRSTRPKSGEIVPISFTAEITAAEPTGPANTRAVKNSNGEGFDHYVFLGSKEAVSKIEPAKLVTAGVLTGTGSSTAKTTYKTGDKIRVKFTGTVRTEGGPVSTTLVEDSNGVTHYLYLYDTSIFPDRRPDAGEAFAVEFTAEVYENKASGPMLTTRVTSPNGNSHFFYLPGLERITGDISDFADRVAASPAFTTAITSADDEITSTAVTERITELEKRPASSFTITRDRNNELLTDFGGKPLQFTATSDASAYLDEQDLEPLRFTINRSGTGLTPEENTELALLRKLVTSGQLLFGNIRWNTTKVVLRPDRYYNESWAKAQAEERFDLGRGSTSGDWPFTFTDWTKAAQYLRDTQSLVIYYDETRYWGKYIM